jgi:hypothetical protein
VLGRALVGVRVGCGGSARCWVLRRHLLVWWGFLGWPSLGPDRLTHLLIPGLALLGFVVWGGGVVVVVVGGGVVVC